MSVLENRHIQNKGMHAFASYSVPETLKKSSNWDSLGRSEKTVQQR